MSFCVILLQLLLTPDAEFRLSGRVFRLVIQLFLYHDFSTVSFLRAFKVRPACLTLMVNKSYAIIFNECRLIFQHFQFALLMHFCENPASILCCSADQVSQRVESLSTEQLDKIRSLPSFRRYYSHISEYFLWITCWNLVLSCFRNLLYFVQCEAQYHSVVSPNTLDTAAACFMACVQNLITFISSRVISPWVAVFWIFWSAMI